MDEIFRLGVLTISDTGSRGERAVDASGDAVCEIMAAEGYTLALRGIVADEKSQISQQLIDWCDGGEVDLVLTTGGTGLGPRDVTPEATRSVLDIEAAGHRRRDADADACDNTLRHAQPRDRRRALRLPHRQPARQRKSCARNP